MSILDEVMRGERIAKIAVNAKIAKIERHEQKQIPTAVLDNTMIRSIWGLARK